MGSKRPDRREFLKGGAALAGGLTLGAVAPAIAQTPSPATAPMLKGTKELIAYGDRSRFVTSVRIPHGGRPSPDAFGLIFHVATPLQDSVGVVTPSSLHYWATTRGSFLPDIDPKEHRLMIHGLVDRPLTFTMDDLKRFPSVTRLHFIECAGNRARPAAKTVQESHGMTSCAEWTGVLLSTLLKEAGIKGTAKWFVAEGAEEVMGASSMPIAKAMDDVIVAYGMNGEPVRPHQGFPVRLLVPGFEGILSTKYVRRIKLVDRYYMNYNDFGHLSEDDGRRGPGLPGRTEIGDHIPVRRTCSCPAADPTKSADWPGPVAERFARWRSPPTAARNGTSPKSKGRRSVWRTPGSAISGTGTDNRPRSCRAARTNSARFNRRKPRSPSTSTSRWIRSTRRGWTTSSCRGGSPAMGACTMALLRLAALVLLLGSTALAQSPRYGIGSTPSAEELRTWDISIGPTGEELPPGRGTAKEGAQVYAKRGCAACHGATGVGGPAPILKAPPAADNADIWERPRVVAAPLPIRDDGLGLHQSRHASR